MCPLLTAAFSPGARPFEDGDSAPDSCDDALTGAFFGVTNVATVRSLPS